MPGASTGITRLRHIGSQEPGTVEDFAIGSSPISATAPPSGAVPDKLLWRIASAARSRPGDLPVPEAGHALLGRTRKLAEQLRAADGGGRELLVEPGPEDDARRAQVPRGAVELDVEPAERRAGIAADEHAGVVAPARVEPPQIEHHPDQRLHAVEQNLARRRRCSDRRARTRAVA